MIALLLVATLNVTSPQVCFTPPKGCQKLILSTIAAAKKQIHVQAYSFTATPIAAALKAAAERGVKVRVLLDKSNTGDALAKSLQGVANLDVLIDDGHAIAHSKVIVIDDNKVLTGSYNFTNAAESRNAENFVIVSSRVLAAKYLAEWTKHLAHSEPIQ